MELLNKPYQDAKAYEARRADRSADAIMINDDSFAKEHLQASSLRES